MKNIFLLTICCTFLLLSCKKESRPVSQRYSLAQNSVWTTEDFKTHYTIQFPIGFDGGIIEVPSSGNIFCKHSDTDSLYYEFPTDIFGFSDFEYSADIIEDTTIVNMRNAILRYSMPYSGYVVDSFYLNTRIDFINADSLVGMFFYTDYNPKSAGILYWKDKNEYDTKAVFKKALFAYYKKENLPTLIEIMRTIKRK